MLPNVVFKQQDMKSETETTQTSNNVYHFRKGNEEKQMNEANTIRSSHSRKNKEIRTKPLQPQQAQGAEQEQEGSRQHSDHIPDIFISFYPSVLVHNGDQMGVSIENSQ